MTYTKACLAGWELLEVVRELMIREFEPCGNLRNVKKYKILHRLGAGGELLMKIQEISRQYKG